MKLRKREIFNYLFFVVLAAAFWLFQVLNQVYEQEIDVPFVINGIPTNVVMTSDVPPTLRVRIKEKGADLFPYVYGGEKMPAIEINFSDYQNINGHIRILSSDLLKSIAGQHGFNILGVKPDTLEMFYNYGLSKCVPVRWQGTIEPAAGFAMSDIRLSQDSVLVYASKQVLDTITAAWLRPVNFPEITDTLKLQCAVQPVRGAKFQPSSIVLSAFTDRMVEKRVQVFVQGVNFPAGKRLRTFPAQVNVTFQVGMKMYRDITASNFILVVNYEDLLRTVGNRCHLALKSTPLGVSQVKIEPNDVEFVIEEDSETSD